MAAPFLKFNYKNWDCLSVVNPIKSVNLRGPGPYSEVSLFQRSVILKLYSTLNPSTPGVLRLLRSRG